MGETFQDNYTVSVQPVIELYQLTANKPQYRNLHQMARIMKAMIFEQLTDLYGDIPYFQAGLGYYERIYTPVYDKQQVIYADLLKEVSQATDSLDKSADKPSGDILYSQTSNQIAEWQMFGNSLLLRMAMRLTKVDPATAQKYVTQVYGKTMLSNNDNAIVQHVLSANSLTSNQDAAQILSQDSTDIRLSSTIISNMKKMNDPRLPVIAWIAFGLDQNGNFPDPDSTNTTAAAQIGLPPGYIIGGLNPAVNLLIAAKDSLPFEGLAGYSRISDNLLSISAPSLILTYAETELLFADAAKRWPALNIGTAESHYNNGVLSAITQLSAYGSSAAISGGDAQTYLTAHPYNDVTGGLSQINMQYWLCTLMDEYEAWSNWRRSGDLPYLKPTDYPGNISNGTIPRRLTYPPSQKTTNLANYNAEVAGLTGGDKVTTRVWWDL